MPSTETPAVDHQQPATHQEYSGVNSLLTDTTVSAYQHALNPSLSSDVTAGTSSRTQGWNTKGNVVVLMENRFPKTVPAAGLTVIVIAGRVSPANWTTG
ncbi:hypothetical protein Acr_00g0054640 [Actinidia rufa]|uniref:Uncharacterized protein n=1 Tax=Actinidia rufa TaxID=165716 RepID=A0A7J0DLQ3_9ERIC|nr:hypothetical protein Acr_00g0054640 [Actinidia rufa]